MLYGDNLCGGPDWAPPFYGSCHWCATYDHCENPSATDHFRLFHHKGVFNHGNHFLMGLVILDVPQGL